MRRQKQGAAASHRENDRYMADFRDASIRPREPTQDRHVRRDCLAVRWPSRPAARAARPAPSRARASRRGAIERSTRPRPTRSAGARATRAARSSTAATGRSSPCPCRTTAPTSSRAARTTRPTASTWRAPARSPSASTTARRAATTRVTGVAHCGGRSVATCGADGRLCLWRSPHARGARHRGRRGVALRAAGRRRAAAAPPGGGLRRHGAALRRRRAARARGGPAGARRRRRPRAGPLRRLGPGGLRPRRPRRPRARLRPRDLLADAAPPAPGGAEKFTSPRLRHTGRFPPRRPHEEAGHCVALCAVGDRLVSGHQDGRVRGWDARDRDDRPAWTAPAHRGRAGAGAASCVAALADDALVATCGADRRVCVVDPRARTRPSTPSASTATSPTASRRSAGTSSSRAPATARCSAATGVALNPQHAVDAAETRRDCSPHGFPAVRARRAVRD